MRRVTRGRSVVRRLAVLTALAFAALLPIAGPAAAAAPEWKLTVTPNADYFLPGHYGVYKIEAENVGKAATKSTEQIILENTPPAGFIAQDVRLFEPALSPSPEFAPPDLAAAPYEVCPTTSVCKWPEGPKKASLPNIRPGHKLVMFVLVAVPSGFNGNLEDHASVSGGGAASSAEALAANAASASPEFGHLGFASALTLTASSDAAYVQAGGHPYQFTTEFRPTTYSTAVDEPGAKAWEYVGTRPLRDPMELGGHLPPGLIVNPQGVPSCSLADFFAQECPRKTIVGVLALQFFGFHESGFRTLKPVYNLQPTGAYPGELGNAPFILITSSVRTGGDYGIDAVSTAAEVSITRVRLTLWGVPADSSHDALRGGCSISEHLFLPAEGTDSLCETQNQEEGQVFPAETERQPFITMPTDCSGQPLPMGGSYNSWELPSQFAEASAEFSAVEGCNGLAFAPTIEARPTTNVADAPSGLAFTLHVPQNEDPDSLATPSLKEAVVRLPAGLSVNPSSANGLQGCSPEQVGMKTAVGETPAHFTEKPAQCPEESAIGTAEVHTPLLHNPLKGVVYLATPKQNPFGSLFAGYIVLEGEGLIIKLPGRIEADPQTGQITGRFTENPQTPFEDFHLVFFGGARGDLRTPPTCGTYTTTSVLTPYSHTETNESGETTEATPIEEPTSSFETTTAAHEGEACPSEASQQPNAPVFRAGTESPQAGAFSPFSFRLARADGSQELSKIETTLPPGLVGRLAGISECSDAQLAVATSREHEGGGAEEQASPSCPASSEVGTVEVAAGAGPDPYITQGKAYLAGPYKGAPLSLAIITPALAGPFDLGDVLVRTALQVNPETAQITAVSDQIPRILQGIPLDVKSITLKMSRPNFTLNPTDCEELGFTGAATSVLGQSAPLSQRFQVGGCSALAFKPKLSLRLKGSPKRAKFPALTATLTMPPGEANIASAQVTLPHSSFLAQAHIAKTCGRPELASHTCPAASIYGHARAVTPLLDHPLEGPVYLATGFGYELPALVADLNGQIEVMLKGKVDSGRADGIRNTFEVVPDAPVSKFTLHMFGGKKSLIENSEYLCGKRAKRKALARFTAQSGKTVELEPTVANSCGKKGKGHHKKHK